MKLEARDVVVIVENKIRAGAKQGDQLLGYYLHYRNRGASRRRILAIYVAPGNLWRSEGANVERVCRSSTRAGSRRIARSRTA